METRDTPHGIVGFKFAKALAKGEYDTAYGMLGEQLKLEYTENGLKQQYENMIDYAQPQEQPDLEVMDNALLGNGSLDEEGWAYIAISGDGWSEAVAVTVKPFGSEYFITDLEWGRP